MSFAISFFARDVHSARAKLYEAHAPAAVKALIELAIASVPVQAFTGGVGGAGQVTTRDTEKASEAVNRTVPAPKRLCGILVETHGHIDEYGGRSSIGAFRVEPYYD